PNIILYHAGAAATRSGPTAAWIASYWHGLQLIKQRSGSEKVLWIDLTGDFSQSRLARDRLRISCQEQDVREIWDRIEWVGLSGGVTALLSGESSIPNLLSELDAHLDATGLSMIVVSGWSDLEESTPEFRTKPLMSIKKALIESISRTAIPVLWFMSPRVSEETSVIYQSRAFGPVDDMLLDDKVAETIWNLPVKPYAFGQITPLLDDLRVIICEQGDDIYPELVEVPPLKEWSSRFWTQQRGGKASYQGTRGRIVLEASDVKESSFLRNEMLQAALEMVPQLRAKRKREESLSVMIEKQPISTTPGIPSRLIYRSYGHKIGMGKGYAASTQSVPAISFRRRYRVDSVSESEIRVTTRIPHLASMRMVGLDHDLARKIEHERLHQVLDFLANLDSESSDTTSLWLSFLSLLEEILATSKDPSMDSAAIPRFLEMHPVSSEVWEVIYWIREKTLLDGVNPRERRLLDVILSQEPAIIQEVGNYLLLLILGISHKYPAIGTDGIKRLWKDASGWVLMQLGLRFDRPVAFNVCALWNFLCKSARYYGTRIVVSNPDTKGIVIVVEAPENLNDFWLFIEEPTNTDRILSGVWRGLNPFFPNDKMRWGLVSHDDITSSAAACDAPSEEYGVVIHHEGDQRYLWIREEYTWQLLGEVQLVRQCRQLLDIRGMHITAQPDSHILPPPAKEEDSHELRIRIQKKLADIRERARRRVPVKIHLDIERNDFVIILLEDNQVLEEVRLRKTAEMIDFLRIPIILHGLSTDFEVYKDAYTWNPYEDIEFGELKIIRPFVERRNPFPGFQFTLPRDVTGFSSLEQEELRVEITHDKSLCPLFLGKSLQHDTCWRMQVHDVINPSLALHLSKRVTDLDIFRLQAAEEIIMGNKQYHLQLRFTPNPTSRDGVVFRESGRIAWQLGLRRLPAGTYLEMDQEKLVCALQKHKNEVQLIVRSNKTADQVYSWLLFKTDSKPDEEELLEALDQTLEGIVETYFGDNQSVEEDVSGYEELVSDLRTMIED
ncbi:MAG: hypothetical protein JW779_05560, partial [Candidatus Thorarchaeota archaeon]|nr:hypothetical protein [Candidatus Thorarchaeota archaeon]